MTRKIIISGLLNSFACFFKILRHKIFVPSHFKQCRFSKQFLTFTSSFVRVKSIPSGEIEVFLQMRLIQHLIFFSQNKNTIQMLHTFSFCIDSFPMLFSYERIPFLIYFFYIPKYLKIYCFMCAKVFWVD